MLKTKILEEIGLTKSEIRVYLALLKLGSSTKKAIVKEAKITPSKLYEITDKLIEKGLVSYVRKNKVMHFSAAPPEQVLDFLDLKKQKIAKQSDDFEKLIPQLKSLTKDQEPEVEVYKGWKGMRTAYQMMLRELKKGEVDYVIGATSGEDVNAASRFFESIHRQRRKKGVVADLEWKKTFITRAKKHNKTIIPVFVEGELSNFFYRLSNLRSTLGLKANLEMLYLCDESFKQRDKTLNIIFGKPIPSSHFDNSKNDKEWAKWMEEKVHAMKNN